ncbi:unnamed protein product [Gongylonema pulchrum]|uniref:BTB domain-containing protein n=1 Tax=Gongylonema pulchrum TaxID=637853 RepID=A0A183DNC8_9BILA|nr:unnamed protein product [Gongylonema pulchrum]
MGALNSSSLKNAGSEWIGPSSTRTCSPARHTRLSSLIASNSNRCFTGKLASLHWRRKCRQISREDKRAFRALISRWTNVELAALFTEMESAWAVREMVLLAEEARPSTSSLATDLLSAWQNEIVTDCFVIHKSVRYAAHSFVLRARCRYFCDFWDSLFVEPSADGNTVSVAFPHDNTSSEMFKAMLYYIYTGEYDKSLSEGDRQHLTTVLQRFRCVFFFFFFFFFEPCCKSTDCTSHLQLEAVRIKVGFDPPFIFHFFFSVDSILVMSAATRSGRGRNRDYRLKCSGAILAARSKYLRSLIEKRIACGQKLEIVINEHLFPRSYAHIILNAIYTDRLDFSKMLEGCQVSASSLTEVQAIASGQRHLAPLRHAIDIFHIAQFLSLPQLAHSCEDAIVAQISVETVSSLWNWAFEPGGSAFVRRHCTAFLRTEFSRICSSHVLFELEEDMLRDCLLSDYVQCAEVEILETVIRWGEHELVRRMEEREPNLIANTTHSISRKGIRRSELNDVELKNILANLLPLVRIDYILPPFHQASFSLNFHPM